MDFKEKFKSLRISMGLSQMKFGEIFGLSQRVISDLERGTSKPSKTLIKYFEFRYGENMGPLSLPIASPEVPYDAKKDLNEGLNALRIKYIEVLEENRYIKIELDKIRKTISKHRSPGKEREVWVILDQLLGLHPKNAGNNNSDS